MSNLHCSAPLLASCPAPLCTSLYFIPCSAPLHAPLRFAPRSASCPAPLHAPLHSMPRSAPLHVLTIRFERSLIWRTFPHQPSHAPMPFPPSSIGKRLSCVGTRTELTEASQGLSATTIGQDQPDTDSLGRDLPPGARVLIEDAHDLQNQDVPFILPHQGREGRTSYQRAQSASGDTDTALENVGPPRCGTAKGQPVLGQRQVSGTWYFFELFLVIFHDSLCCFTPPMFFSLSFTLQRKDNTRAIDPIT